MFIHSMFNTSGQSTVGRTGHGVDSSVDEASGKQRFGDLNSVEGRALAQVVAGDEQSQTVVNCRVATDAADT